MGFFHKIGHNLRKAVHKIGHTTHSVLDKTSKIGHSIKHGINKVMDVLHKHVPILDEALHRKILGTVAVSDVGKLGDSVLHGIDGAKSLAHHLERGATPKTLYRDSKELRDRLRDTSAEFQRIREEARR